MAAERRVARTDPAREGSALDACREVRPQAGDQASGRRAAQSMAREELEGLYLLSRAGEVDFNLTSIPSDYERGNEEEFDREEMRRLYAIGLALGRSDRTWTKAPPGLDSEP